MILAIMMIVAAAGYRLLPHPWNVAPVGAMALLGGFYLGKRYALWVPVLALLGADCFLNTQMGYPMFYWPRVFDYGAFLLIGGIALWLRSRSRKAKLGAVIATPFLFFLISNFGVWLFGLGLSNEAYPKTMAGLMACYAAGLPFLRGTVIGDWGFMALFALVVFLVRNTGNERLGWLAAEAKA